MLHGLTLGVMAISMLIILAGCNYGHEQYHQSVPIDQLAVNEILALEVNDYGRFWDRNAANDIYAFLEKESAAQNIVLVTFIHGWHHNAKLDDDNRISFQTTVQKLQEKVNSDGFGNSRVAMNLQKNVKVFGLYIGWRGQSLPWILDYLTFWGRKAAAERVGGGDLREFLLKLQNLYERRNKNDHAQLTEHDTFMGMVTIGHSFGGQVALRTVVELVERDLVDDRAETDIVPGLGDLTVLLNPAVEAYQYERIYRVTRTGTFTYKQSPVLLTISADNDWARKVWFPIGRWVSLRFRASLKPEETQEWSQALGMYQLQQTHRFGITDKSDTLDGVECIRMDFSTIPQISKVAMNTIPDRSRNNYPFIVASTDNAELIDGHNGIFSETFINFLTEYVALAEGKRICIRRESLSEGNVLPVAK